MNVTLSNARQANMLGDVDLDHAEGMPFVGQSAGNTHIMSILCIATQFKVQCRIADPDRMRLAPRSSIEPAVWCALLRNFSNALRA